MNEPLLDVLAEPLALVVELILFGVLTTVGVLSEQIGIADVTSGQTIGLWYVYVGVLALYVGVYAIGYQRLLPRVREALL